MIVNKLPYRISLNKVRSWIMVFNCNMNAFSRLTSIINLYNENMNLEMTIKKLGSVRQPETNKFFILVLVMLLLLFWCKRSKSRWKKSFAMTFIKKKRFFRPTDPNSWSRRDVTAYITITIKPEILCILHHDIWGTVSVFIVDLNADIRGGFTNLTADYQKLRLEIGVGI